MTDSQLNTNDEALQTPIFGRRASLVFTVALLGLIIGVGAGLLTLMLHGIERLALGYVENEAMPGPFEVPAWRRAVSVIIALTIAGVIWYFLRTKTTKVPSVTKAVNGEKMPLWQTIVHVLLQIFIVGCGTSIGREVAPRELGALLAQRFSSLIRFNARDTRMVVAIIAAAGLAGVYNAPLAGTFFAVEVMLADLSLETLGLSLLGCSLASWSASLIKGSHVFYDLGDVSAQFSPDLIAFAVLGGLVFGLCGALFRRGSSWAEQHKATGTTILWMMPLAGVLTAVVAIWVPQVMGNGRATAQLSFSSTSEMVMAGVLLLSFVIKAVVTLLTIRSGASGGVLQPGIALGASMGGVLGILWMQMFHTNAVAVYALLGACALLSASQQAPLMAMCLVMELTDAPSNLFVPVCCAVAVSTMVSYWLSPRLAEWHPLEQKQSAPAVQENNSNRLQG